MSDLPQTRQSLILRLNASSNDAWAEFLEIYERAIYEFSRRRGLQDADAWDVTQDVLSAVDQKVESWSADPDRGKFRGWLFRVARNIAIDKVIRQAKKRASGDSHVAQLLRELPESKDEQSTVFQLEYRRTLMQWAGKQIKPDFKETSWQSFLLTTVEGRKADDVAAELGISVGSVYAAKVRIVARIRKLVSQFDDAEIVESEILRQMNEGSF